MKRLVLLVGFVTLVAHPALAQRSQKVRGAPRATSLCLGVICSKRLPAFGTVCLLLH